MYSVPPEQAGERLCRCSGVRGRPVLLALLGLFELIESFGLLPASCLLMYSPRLQRRTALPVTRVGFVSGHPLSLFVCVCEFMYVDLLMHKLGAGLYQLQLGQSIPVHQPHRTRPVARIIPMSRRSVLRLVLPSLSFSLSLFLKHND